jgi:hypothetical protein
MSAHETDQPASDFGATLLRVTWLAILLGLAMEVLLVLGLGPIIADFVGNITWSVFVCVGLAVGTAVAWARVSLMGFMGLFSATTLGKKAANRA